jgi:hypothetical protein
MFLLFGGVVMFIFMPSTQTVLSGANVAVYLVASSHSRGHACTSLPAVICR